MVVFFYELFCEGPSALRKYVLTAVRGLMTTRLYSGCFLFLLSRKSQAQTLDRTLFPSVSHDVLKVMNVLTMLAACIVHSL